MRLSRPLHSLLVCSAGLLAFASCEAGNEPASRTSQDSPFGSALVDPQRVGVGDTFSIAPATKIQPICLDVLTVLRGSEIEDREALALLSPTGEWQEFGQTPEPTIALCAPARSAAKQTYVVPEEMVSGIYTVCLSADRDEAGCGSLTVTE